MEFFIFTPSLILTLLISLSAFAEIVSFKSTDGKTEFLAVGKPAMIKINGEGPGPEGVLTVTGTAVSGVLKVSLDKFTTKMDLRDDHMKNKYLEVSKYPEAALEITEIAEKSFKGKLTLHGKASNVEGSFSTEKKDKVITGDADFVFKITDHLDALPSWMGIKVAETVNVKVKLKGTLQ